MFPFRKLRQRFAGVAEILDRIQPVTFFELFQIFVVCFFGLLRFGQVGLLHAAHQRLLHPVYLR